MFGIGRIQFLVGKVDASSAVQTEKDFEELLAC